MKTIVHIELSDSDRNHLAQRIERKVTTRMVTRKEVTEYVLALVDDEIKKGYEDEQEELQPVQRSDDQQSPMPRAGVPKQPDAAFEPSRGDEEYLASPKDPGIAAACSRILDDSALIEQFAWDTIERNRSK